MSYEGKDYKLKKNTIKKMKKKYHATYHYVLSEVLRYKKYLSFYEEMEKEEEKFNQLLIDIMESTAQDMNVRKDKIYNYRKFNKLIKKNFHHLMKNNSSNQLIINYYNLIRKGKYSTLRKISKTEENVFLKVIYLYTISED
ncbi:MAG: hypothetical protein IKE70_00995 [Bacilli bacterium]|nr:hypothetical protein [Bacilli bacterium]